MKKLVRSFNSDFEAIANVYGERIALVSAKMPEVPITYAELDELLNRHIAWFGSVGLMPGDRIGAILPNSIEMLVLFLASLRAGLDFAPLACDSTPAEINEWGELVKPKVCVTADTLSDGLRSGVARLPARGVSICCDSRFSFLPPEEGRASGGARSSKVLIFTSGTTGQPKAIVIDSDRLWSSGHAFIREYGIDFEDGLRIWSYLPQSYLGGIFNMGLIPIAVAGTIVIDETFSGKTFLSFWQTIDRFKINTIWLVPAIVRGLLAIGERTHRNELRSYADVVRRAFLGTAPIDLATKEKFEQLFGIALLENFALSETTFLTAEFPKQLDDRSEGSVGKPLPYVELAILGANDADGEGLGEILVKTPFQADGYLASDGSISSGCDEQGFFATGDTGYLDDKGCLVLTGRCKEIIKRGGYYVSLREAERIAMSHELVFDAAAKPEPHPFYGEAYRLYVQLRENARTDSAAEIKEHVLSRLARSKWPEDIQVVESFPRTQSGKIRKFLLKEGEHEAAK